MAPTKMPGPTGKKKTRLLIYSPPNRRRPIGHDSGSTLKLLGDTPGSVGKGNDFASNPLVCMAKSLPPKQESDDVEVFVFSVAQLLEWAKWSASYGGSIADTTTLARLFREFGATGLANDIQAGKVNYYLKVYNGKSHIIFKGYPGLRKTLSGTKYLAKNTKVLNMAIGKAGLIKSGLRSTAITIVLVGVVDVAQYLLNDKATLADLGVNLFSDLSKATIATAVGTAVGLLVAGTLSGAVIVPLAAAVAVGVIVSEGLNWIDEKLELTQSLSRWANREWRNMKRDYDNTMYKASRQWHFLNTPQGAYWLMRSLSGQ